MKKTILSVVVLVLLLSLCGTGKSYAVSDKRAQKAITETQAYITKWEYAGYAAPEAKKILRRARQAHKAGDYKRARKLAKESLHSLKVEVQAGRRPQVEFQLVDPKTDLSKYRKIAVLGFNDASNAPGSGDVIADLISSGLTEMGYEVIGKAEIEATLGGQKPEAGLIQMGKMLGVDAIVTGVLSQYTIYGIRTRAARIEVTVKMIDTETGSVLWQCSGSYTRVSPVIRPVAQRVINAILDEIP